MIIKEFVLSVVLTSCILIFPSIIRYKILHLATRMGFQEHHEYNWSAKRVRPNERVV